MKIENMLKNAKAYRKNIRDEMFSILTKSAKSYTKNGAALEGKKDLRDAPEYFLNVKIAEGLATKFNALRYDLEYPVKNIVEQYFTKPDGITPKVVMEGAPEWARFGGRFDLVLTGSQSNRIPRYIVEVKRGPRFANDIVRLAYLASLQPDKNRWNYGFVVTLLRRETEEQARLAVISALAGVLENNSSLSLRTIFKKLKDDMDESIKLIGNGRNVGDYLFGFVFIVDLTNS